MSRADDIALAESIVATTGEDLPSALGGGLIGREREALARILPVAIRALRFVEEHGDTLNDSLLFAHTGDESHGVKVGIHASVALAALDTLRWVAERGEP